MSTNMLEKKKSVKNDIQPHKIRFLTGMKPTGDVHLGNYAGAIKPAVDISMRENAEVILLCVDWHGLTNRAQILLPGTLTHKIISVYLALGFNLRNNSILLQSDFRQIQENAWYLGCASAAGFLDRGHAYKDALASGKDATCGLLFYPVLMSSDIVTFDAQLVPVGKDQSQHLEYAADMAKLFNNAVGSNVYIEPKAQIEEFPILFGTDGRKMSKSYNNFIPVFGSKKEIEKAVKEIKTDSKGLDDPKNPEDCLIFQIFKSFATKDAVNDMKEKLERGIGYGYGHAKKDFLLEHERVFSEKQKLYEHYVANFDEVKKLLQPGYERGFEYAETVTKRARTALGLKSYRS